MFFLLFLVLLYRERDDIIKSSSDHVVKPGSSSMEKHHLREELECLNGARKCDRDFP